MMAVTGHLYTDDVDMEPIFLVVDVCQKYFEDIKSGEMKALSVFPGVGYDDPDILYIRSPDHKTLKLSVTHVAYPELLIGKASIQRSVTISVKKISWWDRMWDWWENF
jgi:hypothetical protein